LSHSTPTKEEVYPPHRYRNKIPTDLLVSHLSFCAVLLVEAPKMVAVIPAPKVRVEKPIEKLTAEIRNELRRTIALHNWGCLFTEKGKAKENQGQYMYDLYHGNPKNGGLSHVKMLVNGQGKVLIMYGARWITLSIILSLTCFYLL
jgi:hypothetical protein